MSLSCHTLHSITSPEEWQERKAELIELIEEQKYPKTTKCERFEKLIFERCVSESLIYNDYYENVLIFMYFLIEFYASSQHNDNQQITSNASTSTHATHCFEFLN